MAEADANDSDGLARKARPSDALIRHSPRPRAGAFGHSDQAGSSGSTSSIFRQAPDLNRHTNAIASTAR